jgi:hypothetical protein
MITRATLIWMILAIGAGFGLFRVSDRVATLEEELNRANRQIVAERERLHALNAEWSHLTNPARLGDLSRRHLPLLALSAEQMVRIEDLPLRLPPLVEADGFGHAGPVTNEAAAAGAPTTGPAAQADDPQVDDPQVDDPIADLLQRVSEEP